MQTSRTLGFLFAAAFWAISTDSLAAKPRVLASVTQPPGGLDCARAVDRTEVVFDFQQPRSDIKQLSVFVNGKGVPADAIEQDWPRVTVLRGLHVGRNTVEAVATGADKKSVSHKLTVLVGERPKAGEKDSAIVDCIGGSAAADADSDEPWGEELDDEATEVVEDDVEYVDEDVEYVYDYAPTYVYYPYPAFAYIAYQPAYYYPWPYYSYYYYRPYHHDRYYGGSYSRHDNVWRNHESSGYQRGGDRWNDDRHRYRPNRPPTHSRDSHSQPQNRSQGPPARAERPAPAPRSETHHGGDRGRGWR